MAWAAAMAGPVLISLYLLRLRRRPVRVSSVRYWPATAKDVHVNVPLRMLRPSWLLLLHLLIAAIAVCAVGRPTVSGEGSAGGRIVLLIDTSASMSASTARPGVTRLDDALARARAIVRGDRSSPPARFAVVAFGEEPRVVCGFGTSHRAVLEALSGVTATDQPGQPGKAMELAASLLAGSDEDQSRGGVVLLSDQAATPFEVAVRVRDEPLPFHAEETPANLGIVGFAVRRSDESPAMAVGLAEVVCRSAAQIPTVISISVDGVVAARVPIVAAPGGARTPATFQFACAAGGVIEASLPGEDSLRSDDRAALILAPLAKPRVLLVSPEGPRGGTPLGSALLREVLMELPTSGLEDLSESEWLSRGSLTPPPPSLIVLDRVSPTRAPECPTLTFGADPPGGPAILGSGVAGPPGAIFWDRRHPALRHVSLDGLSLDATPRVSTPEGWSPIARCSAAPMILASGADRWPRLVVTFDLTRSNWPVQAGFPVFVASAVDLLTAREALSRGVGYSTGESIEIPAAPGTSVAIKGPASATAVAGPAAVVATIPPLPLAGLYRAGDLRLAVNLLNAGESMLGGSGPGVSSGGSLVSATGPAERREVWHWFALGVVALLCVEWLVYARLVRA